MNADYWQKQTKEAPLFPDILWSRPENKLTAGKLLIVGGNSFGFSGVGEAYGAATQAGAGSLRALLPNALQKTIGSLLEHVEFAPSTPSGSFASDSVGEFLLQSSWADGVLLAGDFGRNSETAVVLESFIQKYAGPLTLVADAVDYFFTNPEFISNRGNTTLVLESTQLQRFATALHFETPFISTMGMVLLTQALHDLTLRFPFTIVTKEQDNMVVASQGRVSSTKIQIDNPRWAPSAAAKATLFWIQNPGKGYEAITSSYIS